MTAWTEISAELDRHLADEADAQSVALAELVDRELAEDEAA